MKVNNFLSFWVVSTCTILIFSGCDDKPNFPLNGTEWYGEFDGYVNYLDFDKVVYVDAVKADGDTCFDIQFYQYTVDGDDFIIDGYITINWEVVKDTLTLTDDVTSYKFIRTAIDDSSLAAQGCTD
ncbi:hypothetical protein L6Q79_05500 [bacterium]|nr:hypothetical protein [bacterium]NUN44514.1 hypothetical protein [bacterium]